MWLQWLARVMERPRSEAAPTDDPAQTTVRTDVAALPSDSDIAAAEEAMLRFDELAQAPAVV